MNDSSEHDRTRATRQRVANRASPRRLKRILVEHNYHDHLHDSIQISTVETTGEDSNNKHSGPKGGVAVAFPERLHEMLSAVEGEDLEHIVSWQPHGRSFLVHKKDLFVQEIMPRFFHQTKLTSFQRQLNLYGFVRLTTGEDRGGYYHELFLRGRIDLCRQMTRTRIKGNGMKAASSPGTEPNFYTMEFCQDNAEEEARRSETTPIGTFMTDTSEDEANSSGSSSNKKPDRCIPQDITLFSLAAAVVSPPASPNQTRSSSEVDFDSAFKLQNEVKVHFDQDDTFMFENDNLHSGDAVFFEGEKFRYLDSLDLDVFLNDAFTDF